MPITLFTIDGNDVDPLYQSFEIRETTGEVCTLVCDIESIGSPVQRFANLSEIIVEEDSVRIFAGTITQTRERGFGGPNLYDSDTGAEQIVTTITAEDFGRLAERIHVTTTVAEGTLLKTFLTTLVTDYLGDFGVTLHGSQVDGPALPAMTFDLASGAEVLAKLSEATGYLRRIDYDKKLRMWAPGDLTAPFNINEFDDPTHWTDDVEVENIIGDDYANRVIVIGDVITEYGRTETWTGDGVTVEFELIYKAFAWRVVQVGTSPPSYQTVTDPSLEGTGAAMWVYDQTTNTIRRDLSKFPELGIPGVGEYIGFNIDGTFQPYAVAEPSGVDPADVYELVVRSSEVRTTEAAQALADSLLEEHLSAGEQRASYRSRFIAPTLRAGQLQTIAAGPRQLAGDYIITDMTVRAEVPSTADTAPMGLIRSVITKKNHSVGKYQQTYRDWLIDSRGSSGAQTTTTGAVQIGPGGPDKAVQYNDAGQFGGDDDFIYYKTQNSIVCGGGGSSITAVDFESCQVFGYDCHIADG